MESVSHPTAVVRPRRPAGATWRKELREAIRSPAELAQTLGLDARWARLAEAAAEAFPVVAPRPFVRRMRRADPADPLLRQVLPLDAELDPAPGYSADPVGDGPATVSPGVLRKYRGRALLVASGACAVHCRYCFRRHFPYSTAPRGARAWEEALAPLAADDSIEEVILSGGDPLTLTDASLASLLELVRRAPRVRRLRVHTRLPIVIPSRVTQGLLALVRGAPWSVVVVLHANHANEIDDDVACALGRLRAAGAMLLNQSVLLRGVNDSVQALADLSERLLDCGAAPYYLHRLDRVAGAAHFATAEGLGETLVAELRRRLPGYGVPRFVAEEPGEPHKTILA